MRPNQIHRATVLLAISLLLPTVVGCGDFFARLFGGQEEPPAMMTPAGPSETDPPLIELETAGSLVVNQTPLTVRGRVTDASTPVTLTVAAKRVDVAADGAFTASVDLNEGRNQVVVAAFDAAFNPAMQTLDVLLDTTAPDLTVDTPTAGVVLSTKVHVAGRVADKLLPTSLKVAGVDVAPDDDGVFATDVDLSKGSQQFVLEAADTAGNTTRQTIDLNVFISDAMAFQTPMGMRAEFPEGALVHPEQTVEVRDLTNDNVRMSLGLVEGFEVLAAVPQFGLPPEAIVIPGAMAVTFDGPTIDGSLVNKMPAMSVTPMGGLTNDIPLWILQLVPDSNGDGLPELMLVSQARISDDGRLLPVDPPAGSPLPGFQFGSEFAFTDGTISQVNGLTHSSQTFVACCCGMASVPIHGDTDCNPGPTAQKQLDTAKRFADDKRALDMTKRLKEGQRRNHLLNNMLGPNGSITNVFALIGAVALAPAMIEAAGVELTAARAGLLTGGGEAVAIIDDLAGDSPPSTAIGQALALVNAIKDGALDVIERARQDVEKYLDLTVDIAQLNDQMAEFNIQIEGYLGAAHVFSGCSTAIETAAAAAGSAAGELRATAQRNDDLFGAGQTLRAQLTTMADFAGQINASAGAIDPILARIVDRTVSEADIDAMIGHLDQLALAIGGLHGTSSTAMSASTDIESQDTQLEYYEKQDMMTIADELATIDSIPDSGGVAKSGVNVGLEAFEQHHDTTSSGDGSFITYAHTQLVNNPDGSRVLSGATVTAVASAGGFLDGSATASFSDVTFPGAGAFDFSIDVGRITIAMGQALLVDSDGDGVEDGAEMSGQTNPASADTDGDGFNDLAEINALSDPRDPASIPTDDPDGDALPDAEEATAGTDPANPDTDGDRLADGAEIKIHKTDAGKPDTDGDGFTDFAELLLGSDPTNPSSTPGGDGDKDGLPNSAEDVYGTNPDNPDSDGDGLSDGVEVYVKKTNPTKSDTDADTISDGEEAVAGADGFITNPKDDDTDRDHISDPFEIANGSDPTNPASIPADGLIDLIVHARFLDGTPVVGAEVFIFRGGDDLCAGATNAQGDVTCPNLEPGIDVFIEVFDTINDQFIFGYLDVPELIDQGGGQMFVEVVVTAD